MTDEVLFGGRRFRVCENTTLRQDQWVQQHIAASGVFKLEKAPDESPLTYATRITSVMVESGRALKIIAGLLMPAELPEDAPWTEATAQATEEHLANLRDPRDKREFNARLSGLVAGFFAYGLRSLLTSPSFSPSAEVETQPGPSAAH